MSNLSKDVKISSAVTPAEGVAGQVLISGSILDMAGFGAVLMLARFGAIDPSAVTSIYAEQDSDSAMASATKLDVEQDVAETDDGKTFYIDLVRPTERYVRLVVNRSTADSEVSALYLQYDSVVLPVAHGTGVEGELQISPVAEPQG